ncbi:MAG TPA: hypothetical protein VKZ75_08145 [Cyclobacteriaceae bacterium]|jgi:hypothetical protein|nr:hypothetical protein [Cyclobacteriaceae bacterium]
MKIPFALSVITLLSFIVFVSVLRSDSEPWRIAFAAIGFVGFLSMTAVTIYLLRKRNRR